MDIPGRITVGTFRRYLTVTTAEIGRQTERNPLKKILRVIPVKTTGRINVELLRGFWRNSFKNSLRYPRRLELLLKDFLEEFLKGFQEESLYVFEQICEGFTKIFPRKSRRNLWIIQEKTEKVTLCDGLCVL